MFDFVACVFSSGAIARAPALAWARRTVIIASQVAACLVATSVTAQGPEHRKDPPPRPAHPDLQLPDRSSQGQRAIELLGPHLPGVAAWHRKSPDEFRALLLHDRKLRIDGRGRLYAEDTLDSPLEAPAAGSQQSLQDGVLLPLDQTFFLHSKPGSDRTLYLNFRGTTLTNTVWNTTQFPSITAQPFDLDGVPSSFSTAELQRIQYIWQRVAEDFAPFDVNVTTEPPTADRLTRASSTDQVFGATVLVTKRTTGLTCSCGGRAYIGVFDDTSEFYKPALVFYDALGPGDEKFVAEAISHEAGHTLGLLHDGSATTSYYQGHGTGATGWAPIMGVGYYQPVTQWSRGEYAGANNVQDDIAVIQQNGLALRVDDHANTAAGATPLAPAGNGSLAMSGVIERASDVDYFSFAAAAGPVTVNVATAARAPNLDVLVELRNAAGAVIASANPTNVLPAALSATLPAAGTYYVAVQGVGKGSPATDGYSDYGSVGIYELVVGTSQIVAQPPVAAITANPTTGTAPLAVNFSGAGSSDADSPIISYAWTFGDGTAGAAGVTTTHTYSAPGTYTAQLAVTDSTELTGTRTVTITVNPVVAAPIMKVSDIAMRLSIDSNNRARAIASVTIRDANGAAVSGATVAGRWSGLVSGTGSVVTNTSGVASFTSPRSSATTGTFIFSVTGVTRTGATYQPAQNVETSDSISR